MTIHQYVFPQPNGPSDAPCEGLSVLAYMVAAALPGALATGTTPIIAARIAFETACRACELLDKADAVGGNPLNALEDGR